MNDCTQSEEMRQAACVLSSRRPTCCICYVHRTHPLIVLSMPYRGIQIKIYEPDKYSIKRKNIGGRRNHIVFELKWVANYKNSYKKDSNRRSKIMWKFPRNSKYSTRQKSSLFHVATHRLGDSRYHDIGSYYTFYNKQCREIAGCGILLSLLLMHCKFTIS